MNFKEWVDSRRFHYRLKKLSTHPLANIYQPPTITNQPVDQHAYLVLDFETTGLNPRNDFVLSAGWTTIENRRVQWKMCQHHLIKYAHPISDNSVIIHHITEQEAAKGQPIKEILPLLLSQLSGKILVAHFADIEVGFLQQLTRYYYGIELPLIYIDTLQLAFKIKYRHAVYVPQNALTLFSLRHQYNLPRYKAHNALSDAIATAELLLVLQKKISKNVQQFKRV